MKSEKQLYAGSNIHEFFLDDELLLFSEPNNRLYRLNTSAAFIWCYQAGGGDTKEIVQAMADTFGISTEKAQTDVQTTLSEWRRLGLLNFPPAQPARKTSLSEESLETAAIIKHRVPSYLLSSNSNAHEHRYSIANTCFRVRFATRKTQQTVHPLLAHLEVATTPFDTTFDIIPNTNGYLLSQDSAPIANCQNLEQLGPLVHAELLVTACKSAECLAILHAAAITNGKEAFLLPGESGSGKSTLAAALITRGYGYLSDEIGLLTHRPYRVLPVPLSLGMKEGAWSVLTHFHPHITQLPIYQRLDGKKVRYLPPNNTSSPSSSGGYPVKRLFFPRYLAAATTTQIQSISRAEALYRITKGGYDINGCLSVATVAELVNWISTIECYEIRYSCLSDALKHLQKLI